MSRRRNRRPPPRASVPTELTKRADWPSEPEVGIGPAVDESAVGEPDPVVTSPTPLPGSAVVPAADATKLTREQAEWIVKNRKPCAHCHGFHQRYCPRVREVTLYADGNVQTAKYWRTFDDSFIIWPEDLAVDE